MNDIQKRFSMFLLGCIPARLLYTYLAKTSNYKTELGYIAIVIGAGFLYLYLTDSRKTGPEVMGNKIWWDCLRPVHGGLYLLFAYSAIHLKSKNAWKFLMGDTLLGLVSFLAFHYKQGNFSKLF